MNTSPQPCPFLPAAAGWTLERMRAQGRTRNTEFFHATCCYAQAQWLQGKPAQALLQLNRALAVAPHFVASAEILPYQAILWIIQHSSHRFIGNPVRHFQHLATRVNEPNRQLRSWRAWACFHLASNILDATAFPRDEAQIASENLIIPTWTTTLTALLPLGVDGETQLLSELAKNQNPKSGI